MHPYYVDPACDASDLIEERQECHTIRGVRLLSASLFSNHLYDFHRSPSHPRSHIR
jgi:hypothetical protein